MNDMNDSDKSTAIAVKGNRTILLVVGWVCAVLSLFLYPLIFGVVGVISGILATKSGGKAGVVLIVTSIILMGIGLIYSGVILNYTRHYLGI